MGKLAAIDLGTNSMRLLLCEIENGVFLNKRKEIITTRIGKNLSQSGFMSKEAMELNIEALKCFKRFAEDYEAEQIIVIATSAVRDAANKDIFINKVKNEVGVSIKVLSGIEEAYIGMLGVTYDLSADESILIADIGGGSTEIVLSRNKKIEYSVSIDAGAVRMTERFIKNNPIEDKDIENLRIALEHLFSEAIKKIKDLNIDKIVAIGGTATTIAAIFHGMELYNPGVIHNTVLDLPFLVEMFKELKSMDIKERCYIKGLEKDRADIIPTGVFILMFLLEALKKQHFIVSDNDNLEGAAIKFSGVFPKIFD